MGDIVRLTTVWTGFLGAPGYTNLYAPVGSAGAAAVAQAHSGTIHDFWNTVNGFLPADVTVTVGPTYQVIDEVTGDITSEGTVQYPADPIVGTSAAAYAGNAGVAVDWLTGTFINGHRLRGRTFLVPFTSCFEDNGTLGAAAITAIRDAAQVMVDTSAGLVVWHRPIAGAGGDAVSVITARVSDRAAILRSRSV